MKILLYALLFLVTPLLMSQTYDVTGKVMFDCDVDMPGLSFTGSTESLAGKLEQSGEAFQGELTVKVADVDTSGGLPLYKARNEHMREHMKAGEHPEAKLIVKEVKAGSFVGDLTLVGVTKEVKGKASHIAGPDGVLLYKAEFTVDITQWGLTEPSKMGATVNKIIPFKVEAKLAKVL